jgi:hypothetical protein
LIGLGFYLIKERELLYLRKKVILNEEQNISTEFVESDERENDF